MPMHPPIRTAAALLLAGLLAAGAPAQAGKSAARPAETAAETTIEGAAEVLHALEGRLTYYARWLAGRRTASGERFDPEAMTMAHQTLPFGTLVRVTNQANRRSVVLRVNDRGAWAGDRIGDVSIVAARELGMLRKGIAQVRLEVLQAEEAAALSARGNARP